MLTLFNVILGIILLFLGRRIFWVLVGATGFLIGVDYADTFFLGQPLGTLLLVALGFGIVGVLLALLLQKFSVSILGFLVGGYIASSIFFIYGEQSTGFSWVSFLLGGLFGAILSFILFDWAIVVWSSLMGAVLIMSAWRIEPSVSALILCILCVLGILIQARHMKPIKGKSD